jgi:hypothetical protein
MWTLMFGYHEDRTPTHGYGSQCLFGFHRVSVLNVAEDGVSPP